MADTIQLDLVSPAKRLMSGSVGMVVVPGIEGYFGVLPSHMPLLSTLRPPPPWPAEAPGALGGCGEGLPRIVGGDSQTLAGRQKKRH